MKGCILIDIPKYCDDCDLWVNETVYCEWCVLDNSINVTLGEDEYKKIKRPKRCLITQIDESIPIDWIEKKIADIKERPDEDYSISDCYELRISEVWSWLLEFWREENETN